MTADLQNRATKVRRTLMRVIGGILGAAFICVAPLIEAPVDSIWPRWVGVGSIIGSGAYLVFFAITGRTDMIRSIARRFR